MDCYTTQHTAGDFKVWLLGRSLNSPDLRRPEGITISCDCASIIVIDELLRLFSHLACLCVCIRVTGRYMERLWLSSNYPFLLRFSLISLILARSTSVTIMRQPLHITQNKGLDTIRTIERAFVRINTVTLRWDVSKDHAGSEFLP